MRKNIPNRGAVVFHGGKDVYHYAEMRKHHADDEIIAGMKKFYLKRYPTIGTTEAYRRACTTFDYLGMQVNGEGCCQEVRRELDRKGKEVHDASVRIALR